MEKSKKSGTVGIVICAVLLIICIIINVVFATMKDTIAMFLGGYTTSTINTEAEYDIAE